MPCPPSIPGLYKTAFPATLFEAPPDDRGQTASDETLTIQLDGSPNTLPFIDPEEAQTYEIGLKGTFFDGRVSANTALFYIDWKNQAYVDLMAEKGADAWPRIRDILNQS